MARECVGLFFMGFLTAVIGVTHQDTVLGGPSPLCVQDMVSQLMSDSEGLAERIFLAIHDDRSSFAVVEARNVKKFPAEIGELYFYSKMSCDLHWINWGRNDPKFVMNAFNFPFYSGIIWNGQGVHRCPHRQLR